MAQHLTILPEDLEAVALAIGTLNLRQDATTPLVGADIPVKARMLLKKGAIVANNQTIEMWEPHATRPAVIIPIYRRFDINKGRSTSAVAVLVSGSQKQLWAAVSGWSSKTPSEQYQLIASDHISKVRSMCAKIGHSLSTDNFRDQRQPGRFQACHAEKQLLAHLFENQSSRRHARIHLNFRPCDDCHECLQRFVLATGITITVLVHGENDGMVSAAYLAVPRRIRYLRSGRVA